MTVYKDIASLPQFRNAIVTIGTFDGVHTGHRQIIELMKKEAALVNGETVIISFDPHPRQVISGDNQPVLLLNSLEEKIDLLDKNGIDHLVIVPFTIEFASQTADDYIEQFLVNTFKPHTIIIGHDHRFGKNRSGDYELLELRATKYHYKVKEIPGYMLQNITISSTKIRQALQQCNIDVANKFLGYDYFFSGKVIEGNKLGRTIGYPTANLQIEDDNKLIPGNGVYAVTISNKQRAIDNKKGMMNIGMRPTVNGTKRTIEVNIFDFDEDIYGEILTISIKKHLRSEVKFNGLEELKDQLAKDKIAAAEALTD
ncbi:bifunctional riboflavin kinase/FAD synthetase [Ferruginibacter lapsinanis]|uniref:bifunctional riboflavin kinase/FAD synthetase n=1 Tax=Ferruginibacter lapsinanis TaxID=563172 RepID=UPI001E2AD933|nr:bifunctional riboflavin kinase/FAD synthetase [Ferruginibacter lapsinanis]UEG48719.1 bifunctional riboflavin kinase/FAD synthetase [Ferruginibacter lapsinanis]